MRLIRLKEVMAMTGLARSTVYKAIQDGAFPAPVPLGAKAVAWVEAEILEWIQARVSARDRLAAH
ncbi:AlpA family transcriptional regulator [Aquipseudomonas alcaligenes]|uniref:AlpA family transcriptional regulator n=2 Tax=Aquipseudomonas alcaligenes TaxID=43263 RepID=A0A2V4KSZ4_AQUAC|nr:AlpA family transcriptional regulator [Pseudomonas alcaligenes]